MKEDLQTRRSRPICGWLSLLMVSVPIGFFTILLLGGGSGGFRGWYDLALLHGIMIASALVGLVLSVASIKRDEQTLAAYFALLVHGLYLILVLAALAQ